MNYNYLAVSQLYCVLDFCTVLTISILTFSFSLIPISILYLTIILMNLTICSQAIMCDSSPIEECFRSLVEKEILHLERVVRISELKAVKFPPLTSKLRFLLHNTLQDHPAFQTVSVGIEPNRHPIIFKFNSPAKIADVPDGKTFSDHLEEFKFRTGLSVNVDLVKPSNDFTIFMTSTESLSPQFSEDFPFVLVSTTCRYIDIRRALRIYYRKGLVNCYEVENGGKPAHILLTTNKDTANELLKTYGDELNLMPGAKATGPPANVLNIMWKCGQLKPATPRNLVDRSAAANIMSRHLGLPKKAKPLP